jgi:hypothetical protein
MVVERTPQQAKSQQLCIFVAHADAGTYTTSTDFTHFRTLRLIASIKVDGETPDTPSPLFL